MPEHRVPVDVVCSLSDTESHVDDLAFKIDADSERSSSPKSDGSVSEVSDTSEASLSLELADVSDSLAAAVPQADFLIEELDCLKLNEERAEEMARQGADMRHVLCTSWKLQSKYPLDKKFASKAASMVRSPPGQALRDMAHAQKKSIEEHERCMRHINNGQRQQRLSAHRTNSSAGFELGFDFAAAGYDEPPQILVSYADGSNALTLAEKPLCLHNITVSCAVDSCHVFIQQMKNPTYEGLGPLELAMAEAFAEEAPPPLLRPIAHGSLLAVNMDDKWYRCQVVGFNSQADSCDIKFVDHGGYTTVQVSELRPLRSDFVRLPFQAIEVYVAHVSPATDEIVIDITSDLLFRDDVSIQLLGFAEDGVPIVQAYFYQEDFINLLTQEILDDCYQVFLAAHPDYTPVPTQALVCSADEEEVEEEDEDESPSVSGSECTTEEEGEGVKEDVLHDETCQQLSDQHYSSTDEGVWSPEESLYTSSEQLEDTDEVDEEEEEAEEAAVASDVEVYADPTAEPAAVAWVPVAAPAAVLAYCVPDPNTGLFYYVPVVQAAPCYAAYPAAAAAADQLHELPANEEASTGYHHQQHHHYPETAEQYPAADFSKPFEQWSQEDYELYYNQI